MTTRDRQRFEWLRNHDATVTIPCLPKRFYYDARMAVSRAFHAGQFAEARRIREREKRRKKR